jgi:hypothetical protein
MKTYTIATLVNDIVTPLVGLPLTSIRQAERHAATLRKMSPKSQIFVINTDEGV